MAEYSQRLIPEIRFCVANLSHCMLFCDAHLHTLP